MLSCRVTLNKIPVRCFNEGTSEYNKSLVLVLHTLQNKKWRRSGAPPQFIPVYCDMCGNTFNASHCICLLLIECGFGSDTYRSFIVVVEAKHSASQSCVQWYYCERGAKEVASFFQLGVVRKMLRICVL